MAGRGTEPVGEGKESEATLKRPVAGRRHWASATQPGPERRDPGQTARLARVVCSDRVSGESLGAVGCLWLVFERFTESARQVMINAQEVAREFGHARVEPEHELLGLLADPDSDASRALGSLGVTADRARERVVEIVPLGAQRTGSVIPFTPGAKKVLELALREALALGHPHIAPGHLLLGLAHDRDGVAMQVLVSLGADQTAVRDAVAPLLPKAGPPIPQASRPQPGIVTSAPIIRRVLEAAAGRALNDRRAEFGVRDLLAAVADDERAASEFAAFGVDIDAIREALQRERRRDQPAD
jgi:ATP-dependent Clp protease ATP-binding subunit ClpA